MVFLNFGVFCLRRACLCQLAAQHNAHWVVSDTDDEETYAQHVLVFDNQYYDLDPTLNSTTVVELVLPTPNPTTGAYPTPAAGAAFAPATPSWTYAKSGWHVSHISGAQRLRGGAARTLIADGEAGTVFEVTADGEIVWALTLPCAGDYDYSVTPPLADCLFRAARYEADYEGLVGALSAPLECGPSEFEAESVALA